MTPKMEEEKVHICNVMWEFNNDKHATESVKIFALFMTKIFKISFWRYVFDR